MAIGRGIQSDDRQLARVGAHVPAIPLAQLRDRPDAASAGWLKAVRLAGVWIGKREDIVELPQIPRLAIRAGLPLCFVLAIEVCAARSNESFGDEAHAALGRLAFLPLQPTNLEIVDMCDEAKTLIELGGILAADPLAVLAELQQVALD